MVDLSVLPITVITAVATLYSVFTAVFIFMFSSKKIKEKKGMLVVFNLMSSIVLFTLFYNFLVLYLLCDYSGIQPFIFKNLLSSYDGSALSFILSRVLNILPRNFGWMELSYLTFIFSSGIVVIYGKMMIRFLFFMDTSESTSVASTAKCRIKPITVIQDRSIFEDWHDTSSTEESVISKTLDFIYRCFDAIEDKLKSIVGILKKIIPNELFLSKSIFDRFDYLFILMTVFFAIIFCGFLLTFVLVIIVHLFAWFFTRYLGSKLNK